MSDIWTCSIDYSAFSATLGTDGNPDSNAYLYSIEFHVIALPVDASLPRYNYSPDYGHFVCRIGTLADGTSSMGLQMQAGDNVIAPGSWTSFFEVPTIFSDYATLAAGGTITFTKDYDSDLLTVTSPLGTQSMTLSHLDPFLGGGPSYLNTYPLVPQGFGAEFTLANPTFAFPAYALAHTTSWSNIVAQKNGVTYQTYPLSAADPGAFYTDTGLAFDPAAITISNVTSPFWTVTQETFDQKIDAAVTVMNFPAYRIFDYWRNLRAPTPPSGPDSCLITDHGPIALIYVDAANSETLLYRIDAGDALAVLTGTVYTASGAANSSPSVIWTPDALRTCWHDGTNIVQAHSFDFGKTWSTPVALSITGTGPRMVVDPNHGRAFYFYHDGSDIKVQSSGDYGTTLETAHTVVAMADAQTVAAAIGTDGRLYVDYTASGVIAQVKSRDMGVTWS